MGFVVGRVVLALVAMFLALELGHPAISEVVRDAIEYIDDKSL